MCKLLNKKWRKINCFLCGKTPFLILFYCFGVVGASAQGTIYVEDGGIYSSCGEEIVMRGFNEMFVWSNDKTGTTILPEIAKTGSNAVRLVWLTTESATEFDELIGNTIENQMIPVAELHDATGDFSKFQELLDYWTQTEVLATIQKYKKWMVVNIGNEVGDGSETVAEWVTYYQDAITLLRHAGVDTPLMIDCGGWGNQERYFLEGGEELLEFDPLHNIIFSVHTYWTDAGDQAKLDRLNTMISDAKSKNLTYVIGEGPQLVASPSACEDEFPYSEAMRILLEEKIGWLSWSWGAVNNGDCGTPNSKLDITTNGVFGSWGTTFAEALNISDPNSIANTSIIPESMSDALDAGCGSFFTISASSGEGGIVFPSDDFLIREGNDRDFFIRANSGYRVSDVMVDGSSVGPLEDFTFSNVTSDHTLVVTFEDASSVNCEFNTPMSASLPSLNASYRHVHVLGSGGPDLSNAYNFSINWDLQRNQLWQFAISTSDGNPEFLNDFTNSMTHSFNESQPQATFSGTEFAGLDGDYYIAQVGEDLALVSTTGGFSIYFSNDASLPDCNQTITSVGGSDGYDELLVYPNPSLNYFNLEIPNLISNHSLQLYDLSGKYMMDLTAETIDGNVKFGENLSEGVYLLRLHQGETTVTRRIIKQVN